MFCFSRFIGSCNIIKSSLVNSSSLTRSLMFLAFRLSCSTVSHKYTLPDVLIATIFEKSVKTFFVTGSTYSPFSFLSNFKEIRVRPSSFSPLTGFVPCFFSHGMMCFISKIVPSGVQTGCSKGWSESAQCVNGSRLKAFFCLRATMPPAPPC
jgi:hypothetical protein